MPKLKYVDTLAREQWVIDEFRKNPSISGPKMLKLIKKQFKHSMRAVRVYELRSNVLKDMGWSRDQYGHPVPPQATLPHPVSTEKYAEEAHRNEGSQGQAKVSVDPLAGRCVVPCEDVTDGVSFQQKIALMNDKGFLMPKLRVEAVTDTYVILKHD